MKIMISLILIILFLGFLFNHLIKQSKKPSGIIGSVMMKLWNKTYLPMVKWTVSNLKKSQNSMNILDVGVGNGESTKYLKEVYPKAELYGIDISEKGIHEAKKVANEIYYQVKDVKDTGFPDNYIGLIFAFQTHFHWNDLKESLIELRRVLLTDGEIIITSERSKVKYYLKEFVEIEKFSDYLNDLGLELVNSRTTLNWIEYKIKKKAIVYNSIN